MEFPISTVFHTNIDAVRCRTTHMAFNGIACEPATEGTQQRRGDAAVTAAECMAYQAASNRTACCTNPGSVAFFTLLLYRGDVPARAAGRFR